MPKWELSKEKYLTEQEAQQMIDCVTRLAKEEQKEFKHYWRRTLIMLRLLLSTGMRVSELAHVRHCHLDLGAELPSVFVSKSKRGKSRYIPASKELVSDLKDFIKWKQNYGLDTSPNAFLLPSMKCPGKPMSINGLEQQFLKAVEVSSVSRRTIHSGRHYLGVKMFNSKKVGGNLKLIQQILGHSSTETSSIYCHIPWDKLSGYVEAMAQEKA